MSIILLRCVYLQILKYTLQHMCKFQVCIIRDINTRALFRLLLLLFFLFHFLLSGGIVKVATHLKRNAFQNL